MKMKIGKDAGVVYSTEHGRLCPRCGQAARQCACRRREPPPQGDGVVRVARETKGRKGKGVTLITGVPLAEEGLRLLARELKQRCGTGGTVKGGVIEIQGDQRETLLEELARRGYRVKRAGG